MICLYFGPADECQSCGGWVKAEGGPFEGDRRFCSEDCYTDAMELRDRIAQRTATAWCRACGYDNHEHAPNCEAEGPVPMCPGGCGCRLGTDDADRFECGCDEGCCE